MALNKSHLRSISRVCLALSYLDGDVDPAEVAAFELAIRDLGVSKSEVTEVIKAALREVQSHARNLDGLISAECRKIPKAQHASLFEAAAHMVLADGELTDAECQRLAALRAFLGLPEAAAYAIVASVAHAEPKLRCHVTKAVLAS
jgi:uncharacterized tellurite resistance protein B-like protein